MLDLLSEPQRWINKSGAEVFVSFFMASGTLQVPRYNSTFNSEFYGLPEGFNSSSYDENSCIIQVGDTSIFVPNGREILVEARGYRRAEEALPPPPGFDPPN
jgi:hypothetical protein